MAAGGVMVSPRAPIIGSSSLASTDSSASKAWPSKGTLPTGSARASMREKAPARPRGEGFGGRGFWPDFRGFSDLAASGILGAIMFVA